MYVYILECEDNSYYVGIAKDLQKRLTNHGKGSKYTKAKKPKQLVYVEDAENAYKREPEIKKLTRQKKTELIQSELNQIDNYRDIVVS
ncbi:MAG: GIY-YIG nuclease family protein [Candidatus Margulisbacteria bacterium]|nr:GIY-YIG nuclease family protein [Candidatus Margulisiibacteriota bacterium]